MAAAPSKRGRGPASDTVTMNASDKPAADVTTKPAQSSAATGAADPAQTKRDAFRAAFVAAVDEAAVAPSLALVDAFRAVSAQARFVATVTSDVVGAALADADYPRAACANALAALLGNLPSGRVSGPTLDPRDRAVMALAALRVAGVDVLASLASDVDVTAVLADADTVADGIVSGALAAFVSADTRSTFDARVARAVAAVGAAERVTNAGERRGAGVLARHVASVMVARDASDDASPLTMAALASAVTAAFPGFRPASDGAVRNVVATRGAYRGAVGPLPGVTVADATDTGSPRAVVLADRAACAAFADGSDAT